MNIHRTTHHALIIAAALLAAACGDSSRPASPLTPSPLSDVLPAVNGGTPPAAPGTSGSTGTSGAKVTGVVNGGGGMTVTVAGTSIAATVDGSGHFALEGVPPGDVELRFSGAGLEVPLALAAVANDEQIEISITVSGSNAQVTSQQRTSSDSRIELRGAVSGLSGGCPDITFTLNSKPVTTSATTFFEDGTCSTVQNGTRVEVKGTKQANGSVSAMAVWLSSSVPVATSARRVPIAHASIHIGVASGAIV